jgi:translocon-associated protein subunit gamma
LNKKNNNNRIALKRDQAINAEVSALLGDSKKYTKKDREDRIQWTKSEVSEYEATTFSIFYNNCLFIVILLVASFFMFKNFTPVL